MIQIHDLPNDAALAAIREGEFPSTIIGRPHVAIVMTQNWCPDWLRMRSWLKRMEKAGEPAGFDLDVYVLIYNKTDYFTEFLHHKENSFGNSVIPYVRYYAVGTYLGDSNQLSRDQFLATFDP